MSKPEAGQWWETSKGRRFKIIGQLQKTGHFVLDDNSGIPDWCPPMAIAECTYLPDCTGFDWVVPDQPQPAEDPDEWVEISDPDHLVRPCDELSDYGTEWYPSSVEDHGKRLYCVGFNMFRCKRRDLPKVEQAEQWPKYYATFDSSDSPVAYVKRPYRNQKVFVRKDGIEVAIDEWSAADDERTELTEAEAMALLNKPKQCAACDAPVEPGTAGCRDCNEYATAICSPEPQPAKTRVRLWATQDGIVWMDNDALIPECWHEIHHDTEGFYVVE